MTSLNVCCDKGQLSGPMPLFVSVCKCLISFHYVRLYSETIKQVCQLPTMPLTRKQLYKFLHLNLFHHCFYCLTAYNTTKHTYSRSVCFSDSCPLQGLRVWGHQEDRSLHNWCGCVLEAPRALAPTGPLTRHKCPDKDSCYLQLLYDTISFQETSIYRFYLHHIGYWLERRSSTMSEQDLDQF